MACFKKVTVYLADGNQFTTSINKDLSNKEIRNYYLKRGSLNMAEIKYDPKTGREYERDNYVKIKKVVVSKKLSCY